MSNSSSEEKPDELQNELQLMSSFKLSRPDVFLVKTLMFVKIAKAFVFNASSSNPTPRSNPDRLLVTTSRRLPKRPCGFRPRTDYNFPAEHLKMIILTLCNKINQETTLTIKNNHVQYFNRLICIFVYFPKYNYLLPGLPPATCHCNSLFSCSFFS